MNLNSFDGRWFAIQVWSRREKATAALLKMKGYELFVPCSTTAGLRQVDALSEDKPLFPGYVFCRFDSSIAHPIVATAGVIRIVGFGQNPVPIDDEEIKSISTICQSGLPTGPSPYLHLGQLVTIDQGALCGVRGTLVAFKNRFRLIVSVNMLRRSIFVECNCNHISWDSVSRERVLRSGTR